MEQLKKTFLSLALLLASTIMYAQSEISGNVVDPTILLYQELSKMIITEY